MMIFTILFFVLTVSMALLPTDCFSQSLPNTGFENWVPSGREPPFDWEEPEGWKSTNGVTEFIAAGITRTSVNHSGMLAVQIKSANIFGSNYPAMLVNGNPELQFEDFSIVLETAGTPYTARPSQLTGFYTFDASETEDSAYVYVLLKRYNSSEGKTDTIGVGSTTLAPVAAFFAEFAVPIEYRDEINDPDSVIVAFYSSKPDNPFNGGVLIVDDIALDVSTDVEDESELKNGLHIYPNPASGLITINLPRKINAYNARIDILAPTGTVLRSFRVSDNLSQRIRMSVAGITAGVYFVRLRDRLGSRVQQITILP